MNTKGFAFSEDTDMQRDFELRFAYDETEDQLRSIDEIKSDMQRSAPMDRLLCGDTLRARKMEQIERLSSYSKRT